MAPVTEQQLVNDLQAKLPTAFHQLYDGYSPALYGVILRLVKDEDLAQDLLHDAFIKIWTNIGNFNPEKGRLFTLTRNVVIDELRVQKQKSKFESYLAHHMQISHKPSLSDQLIDKSLLNRLRPVHRQVVELTYFKDYTQQEIADKLSIPLGTVKTRIRTAMQKLHLLLSKDIHQYHLNAVHL